MRAGWLRAGHVAAEDKKVDLAMWMGQRALTRDRFDHPPDAGDTRAAFPLRDRLLASATEAGSGAGGHSQRLFEAQGVVAAGDVTMHQRGMIARAAAAASLADRLPGTS